MAVNKVEYGDATVIDLTADTVSADTLAEGITAHASNGEIITGTLNFDNYYTKEETEALIPDVSNFATTGYVNQQIGKIDFSNYATKAEIPNIDGLATETFVNASIAAAQPDLSGYALKSEIPSVKGLATETYVNQQIGKIDLTSYATKTDISSLASTSYVDTEIAEVVAVASGKTASYVFDTVGDLDSWLAVSTNTAKLKTGDVFLIRAVNVPDYWWDSSTKSKQILETTKVDLSSYAKTADVPAIKVNNATSADTVGGYTIVIAGSAPTNANSKTITFVTG